MPVMTIQQAVKAARGKMSQADLAAAVGLTQSAISDIENGRRAVTIPEMVAIEVECGRPPGWILRAIGHLGGDGDTEAAIESDPAIPDAVRGALLAAYRHAVESHEGR